MEPSFEKVQHARLALGRPRSVQGRGAGVMPCTYPRGRHDVAGFAKPWPCALTGQAVPAAQRFGTGQHGQRASTAPQRPPMGLGQLSPLGFCREHERHVLVTLCQDSPRVPEGVVVGLRFRQVAGVRRHQVLHIVCFPQGVDAFLVGALSVVVASGVKRNVGVGQIMAQIGGDAKHVLHICRGGVRGRHRAHEFPVGPKELPRQHPKTARIQGAVARGHQGFVVFPLHANQLVRI
jgi:hypothetical protein